MWQRQQSEPVTSLRMGLLLHRTHAARYGLIATSLCCRHAWPSHRTLRGLSSVLLHRSISWYAYMLAGAHSLPHSSACIPDVLTEDRILLLSMCKRGHQTSMRIFCRPSAIIGTLQFIG